MTAAWVHGVVHPVRIRKLAVGEAFCLPYGCFGAIFLSVWNSHMELLTIFDFEGIWVLTALVGLVAFVLVCAYLQRQRRMLGNKPGVGANNRGLVFPKRCPRGICTTPGASCPRECVEEPLVKSLVDGRVVHEYDNVEVCFGPGNRVLELKVDGKVWL